MYVASREDPQRKPSYGTVRGCVFVCYFDCCVIDVSNTTREKREDKKGDPCGKAQKKVAKRNHNLEGSIWESPAKQCEWIIPKVQRTTHGPIIE